MKNILLLLIAVISLNTASFSQDKCEDKNTTELCEKVYSDIKNVVSELSETLKVGSEHVYKTMIKQQKVKVYYGFLILILFILFLCLFIWSLKKSSSFDYDDKSFFIESAIVSGVISSILLIVFCVSSCPNIIQGIVNPEYGAIKDIMDLVNGIN